MSIASRVLAAFHAEHREQVEGIRRVLESWGSSAAEARRAGLDEAYRLAHSFKAGARVCDLRALEAVGHRLEMVLSRARSGELDITPGVVRNLHAVLNAIEDWMAALAEGQAPGEPTAAAAALAQILPDGAPHAARATDDDLRRRMVAAFEQEHREHVAGLRRVLSMAARGPLGPAELDEAVRLGHTLRGAARVAEFPEIEAIGARLEAQFARIRDGLATLDRAGIETAAAAIEAVVREMERRGFARRTGDEPSDQPQTTQAAPAAADAPAASADTIRISADALDRLLQTADQLVVESRGQEELARELGECGRLIAALADLWESARRSTAPDRRHASATAHDPRAARLIEAMGHHVRELVRADRRTRTLQRRHAASLHSACDQLGRDARRARLVSAETVFQGLRRHVRDLARTEGKEVEIECVGLDVRADRVVLQALKDPVLHMLRNAVVHGIEPPDERERRGRGRSGRVVLALRAAGNRLTVRVEDDGRGIDTRAVADAAVRCGLLDRSEVARRSPHELARLIFRPGVTTAASVHELAGRGMGLSVVSEAVSRLRGEVRVTPARGGGTAIELVVPMFVSTHHVVLVSAAGRTYAIPAQGIDRVLRVDAGSIRTIEGRPTVTIEGRPVALATLAHLLGAGDGSVARAGDSLAAVVLRAGDERVAAAVDEFGAERDALIRALDPPASEVGCFSGGVLLEDGSVALVVSPSALVERLGSSDQPLVLAEGSAPAAPRVPTILVVDDSFTTRTLERSILEAEGYHVRVAVDGVEALAQLRAGDIDLVISDIQMPRMDGFALLAEMKRDERLRELPVILVTSMDSREDQERGLSLGADAYIVKQKFEHQALLETLEQYLAPSNAPREGAPARAAMGGRA